MQQEIFLSQCLPFGTCLVLEMFLFSFILKNFIRKETVSEIIMRGKSLRIHRGTLRFNYKFVQILDKLHEKDI